MQTDIALPIGSKTYHESKYGKANISNAFLGSVMGFKEWILPQEKVFFNFLEEQADLAVKVAELFQTMLREYDSLDVLMKRMRVMEHEGDELVHKIFQKLNKSFITPIDQQDISKLASLYDDVIDLIDATANRISLFKIIPNDIMKEFAGIIVRQVEEVSAATKHIRKINQLEIENRFKEVNSLENEADDLYDFALVELFKGTDSVKIMMIKDIYEFLEQITDKCEDVCLVIQDIVIKNA